MLEWIMLIICIITFIGFIGGVALVLGWCLIEMVKMILEVL